MRKRHAVCPGRRSHPRVAIWPESRESWHHRKHGLRARWPKLRAGCPDNQFCRSASPRRPRSASCCPINMCSRSLATWIDLFHQKGLQQTHHLMNHRDANADDFGSCYGSTLAVEARGRRGFCAYGQVAHQSQDLVFGISHRKTAHYIKLKSAATASKFSA